MPEFKVGDRVRRVRNSTGEPSSVLCIRPGDYFTVSRVKYTPSCVCKLVSTDGDFAKAADCELVEPATLPESELCTHAKERYEYGLDCLVHPRPWELWEWSKDNIHWEKIPHHPMFFPDKFYRRKPPAPLTEEPEHGATVWLVVHDAIAQLSYDRGSKYHRRFFQRDQLYATEADAKERYDRITTPTRRSET